tara:strand:+ start:26 stop:502 length:477 start_codon:yes stop_codon:yes gene_type:complete
MKFWNNLINYLKGKPKTATDFIQKFIDVTKKRRAQLEIIRNNEILVQVDSLRKTRSWFLVFDVDQKHYKNGFVIFFIVETENIENEERFINYKKSELNLLELDEMIGETPIRTFAKFIKETDDAVFLGKEMKDIIYSIFKTEEKDPQAIFNVRYIDSE